MSESLREQLAAALDASEAGTLEAPAEVAIEHVEPEPEVEKPARVRDETGKFAKVEPKVEGTEEPKEAPIVETPARKPPSSWKKDYWKDWGELKPTLQDYIDQREGEAAKGVSTYKQQAEQAEPIYRAIQPFLPHLQQRGVAPDKWLADLGQVDRILSSGTPQQKGELIARMAAANGIDLQSLVSGQPNPGFGHMAETVTALQQRVQQFESQQQQIEQARLQETIRAFSADKPHFEAVRGTMGQLLQSGVATDLPTAYDKAIRLHDDIWQQHQAQQAEAANRQQAIAKKKAAASSPKSASPTGLQTSGNGNKKSLRETLVESFDSISSGRV